MLTLLTILLIYVVTIIAHELFHAWVAICFNMKIEKIYIGWPLPPNIAVIKRKNYEIVITPWILLGGGVLIEEDSYWKSAFWQKLLMLLYGPMANIILAMLIALMVLGESNGLLVSRETFQAFTEAIKLFLLGSVEASDVSGPVEIAAISQQIMNNDWLTGVLFITLILNIGVAVINLLPLPGLDGGQIVLAGICAMKKNSTNSIKLAKHLNIAFFYLYVLFIFYFVINEIAGLII
ncbi:hypothetical protein A2382_04135 [Candidatus Woesebacteria bacterium RIFOXYB1_FULL_38_16]|uniref:Peptidase M50 domain-containing protein n=1 Tax=Candidatus Woesebacteria bacterium RIFOXYB1_FULL_38_16 TaxID=1802538 RepID=A0A1F8CSJ1_9BACT|nr:MAG: hypothetical protein A2191_05130 [Candidatus Woesebacteria bacterium RIFOXYA1_FULL_38_9]OGM78728.1 MAG: hypothetical protein A2382_04135 [Candidatus Woesebacteria bacterium RIFOXYB1_FULL_38_16]